MRRFLAIDPDEQRLSTFSADSFENALRHVGLEPGHVDFGTLARERNGTVVQIVVFEFGLYEPKSAYFTLGKNLYAGKALVFQEATKNRDYEISVELHYAKAVRKALRWYADAKAVETGIAKGEIERPTFAVNDETVWRWPDDLETACKEA